MEFGRTFCLSHSQTTNQIFLLPVQPARQQLETSYWRATMVVLRQLTKLFWKPVRSKATHFVHRQKPSVLFFVSSQVKTPSSYDKTAATAVSTLISLAAARLAVASCLFSVSSVISRGSLQQLLPGGFKLERRWRIFSRWIRGIETTDALCIKELTKIYENEKPVPSSSQLKRIYGTSSPFHTSIRLRPPTPYKHLIRSEENEL